MSETCEITLQVNVDSMLKSSLTPDQYIILLLLHKKEFKTVEKLVMRMFGYTDSYVGEVYELLQEDGWIKITGKNLPKDIEIRQQFIELLNTSTDMGISGWIDEYRALFKGKKPGCIGDRDMAIKNMTWLLTTYPQYTKEDVMKAAKYYISTCAKDGYKYLVRSNYFLSKEDASGNKSHQILTFLEETKAEEFIEPEDFTKNI